MKKIIIISDTFPYGGEPFLKNELDFAKHVDADISILPIYNKTNSTHERYKDFKIININIRKNILIKFKALFNSIYFLFKDLTLNDINKKFIYKLLKCVYFSYTSEVDYLRIRKVLKKENLSANLVFYSYWMYKHAYIACRLKNSYIGSIAISRCHGYDLYEDRAPNSYIPFRKYILENLNTIFPISKNGEEYLKKRYSYLPNEKVIMSYLGTFDYGTNNTYLNENNTVLNIVSCSNLVKVKRVNLIIETLSQICEIKVNWTHFGNGELRDSLENLAKKKLLDNIQWNFFGHIENDKLMKIYKNKSIDLFLNVSSSEGLPVSIMEACSFGIPVIATDVGGTSEIIKDGINGYLLDKDFSTEDLKEKILRYYNLTDTEKTFYRNNSRKVWERNFNAEKNYKKFYKEIVEIKGDY